jgi:hypothetical protein
MAKGGTFSLRSGLVIMSLCAGLQFSYASDSPKQYEKPAVEAQKEASSSPATPVKDVVAIVLSALAFFVSVGNVLYGIRKDKRARQQSIEDDFWLRKVLGPLAIEPLIQRVLEISSKLPSDCSETGWDAEKLKSFGLEYQTAVKELQSNAVALSLLDKALAEFASERLEKLEDLLLEYCAANVGKRKNQDGRAVYTRAATNSSIQDLLLTVLERVKQFQISGKVKR